MVKEMEKENNMIVLVDLIFEGEYSYGKRNGKGREFNSNGELVYEGEYLNGEKLNK